jgi:hypothetical protein
MENLKAKQQRDAEMVMISRVLNDMYKATTSGGHFSSLAKLAAPHNLDGKYVSSIRKLKIVMPIHNTQGRRTNTKFQWNERGGVTAELAEKVYEYAHSEMRLKSSQENEDAKFLHKISDKNLSKICHTTLKAPGTVLKFLDEVHKLCPCTFIELFRLTESENPDETKVNKNIIAYLKKTSFVKEDDLGNIFWNDNESPSIELAKAVSADLMTEPTEPPAKLEVTPAVMEEINKIIPVITTPQQPEMNTDTTVRKLRKDGLRTLRLKSDIKNLLIDAASGKTFAVNPLNLFSNSNIKMIMRPLFDKLDNGRYRIKPFQETPDEKATLIYETLQAYQRPILKKSDEKRLRKKPATVQPGAVTTPIVKAEETPAPVVKTEPVKKAEPTVLNDVNDLLLAAEELKLLKENIKEQVSQYKSILMRFGYTDARLSVEIADILK